MLSLPEYCGGFKGKDQTVSKPRQSCRWGTCTGGTVYGFLRDDAREAICDSMGVLYAKYPLRLSPADSTAGCTADDACERHHRR
jgi:hypothetical protein